MNYPVTCQKGRFPKKAVEKAANKKTFNPTKFYDWSIHGRFGNGLSGMIPSDLHEVGNVLPVGQYLGEVLGAEYVPQGRLGEQASRAVSILNVCDARRRVGHAVVDHSVHCHRHRVLG